MIVSRTRKIFEPTRKEVTADGRNLYSEELHDLYSSPNVTWLMKLDEIGGVVALTWDRRATCRLWWGNLKERGHLGIYAMIILKGTLKKSGCA
jgi:hypothetical protein